MPTSETPASIRNAQNGRESAPGSAEGGGRLTGVSALARARRQGAVDDARHSTEMEGGRVSEAAEADLAQYVAGELSTDDLIERAHRRVAAWRVSQSTGG